MSNYSSKNVALESWDELGQQLSTHLAYVQAQELAKLLGEKSLNLITQAWASQIDIKHQPSSTELLNELEQSGLPVDHDLRSLSLNTHPTDMLNAIAALKEAIAEDRVKHPVSFLKKAIMGKWKPNSRNLI